ncbi:MAG TPA: zinc-binding dehydrogenase [Candidatus Hypogeohydataceae bacterium YC41]
MKAIVFHEHGGLEKLRYEEVEEPRPQAHEVKVRVRACGVNHLDIWVREGLRGPNIPMPHTLGSEVTGEIVELGTGVKNLKTGKKVLVAPGLSCRRCKHCLEGNDSQCKEFKILGYQVQGGYAEYVCVPEQNIIPLPEGTSFEEWAAVPLVFLTAWHMLIGRAKLRPGERVLIHAAGSGIGSAAVQIARLAGATVVATVGSPEKAEKAKGLGAHEVINYKEKDFTQEVKRFTMGEGVEVVFEHVGLETWEKSLACLAHGGRMVICGATSGPIVSLNIPYLFMKQISIHGCYMGGQKELLEVLSLVEQKRLRPVVDTVYPLKEAASAQKRMQERNFFGKLVLRP